MYFGSKKGPKIYHVSNFEIHSFMFKISRVKVIYLTD